MTTLQITDPEERAEGTSSVSLTADTFPSRGRLGGTNSENSDKDGDTFDSLIADIVADLKGMDAVSVGLLIMRMAIWLEEPTPEHREGLAAAARLLAKQMTKNEP